MKTNNEIDSKFRFVIIAAKRAKHLLHGAKPRIKSKSKNPIRIAQKEVREGLIDFEIVEVKKEKILKPAEEGFIGEKIAQTPEGMEEKKSKKPEKKPKVAEKKKPQKKVAKKSGKTEKTQKGTTPKKTQKKKT
ncbi:MAG: DNA-directed RNA polymerase subunit omega [Candidatus Aminicenantes bacterium]|nr:DNA-directed RNA polymerase subunit omega [Candidatus Aminicenantes bacterium]